MIKTEHLLLILGEEGTEVQHRVNKALRFGLHEIEPGQTKTNAQRIADEVADVIAMAEWLFEEGLIPTFNSYPQKQAKVEKVLHFLELSKKQGTLTGAD